MSRVDTKLSTLGSIYNSCMADYETALVMYPDHPVTLEVKKKLVSMFEKNIDLFPSVEPGMKMPTIQQNQRSKIPSDCLTPWSTQLVEVLDEIARNAPAEKQKKPHEQEEAHEFPSFNLGITPPNQPKVEETRVDDQVVKGNDMVVQEGMGNMVVSRPSRFKKLAASIKSPYLQRVKPIKAGGINSEERALWEWLFDNRRSLK